MSTSPHAPASGSGGRRRYHWAWRLAGYTVVAALWGAVLVLLGVFVVSYAIYRDLRSPGGSHWVEGTRFEAIAGDLYFRQFKGWLDDPARAQFDPMLIYVPTPGTARFRSPEFDTVITMTSEGMRQQTATGRDDRTAPIVMVGDSYTMGWGVNDAETFSALLARRYGHPTINTGVTSYATARELMRLQRLGLLARAKILVIQYCPNDAPENHKLLENPGHEFGQSEVTHRWNVIMKGRRRQIPEEVSYRRILRSVAGLFFGRLRAASLRELMTDVVHPSPPPPTSYDASYPDAAGEFLAVLDRFPELALKPIIVTELKEPIEESNFLTDLVKRARGRANLHVVPLALERRDFFRFDSHLNVRGNETVAEQLDRAIRAVERELPSGTTPR